MLLVVILVIFGLEDYLVRETAAARGRQDPQAAARLWNFSRGFILAFSLTAVACLYCLLPWLEFEDLNLRPTFMVGPIMIPLLCMIAIYRGRFRANKQILKSLIPENLIRPILQWESLVSCCGLQLPATRQPLCKSTWARRLWQWRFACLPHTALAPKRSTQAKPT